MVAPLAASAASAAPSDLAPRATSAADAAASAFAATVVVASLS